MATAKKSKAEWVVLGGKPGEIGYCTRCGQGLNINLPQPIPIFVACSDAFVKMHQHCQPGEYVEKPAQSPEEWARGRDTGTSSLTIYSVLTGHPNPHGRNAAPRDPADFGRCYRLLQLFPAWRSRLNEVAEQYPEWTALVREWAELERLYVAELAALDAGKRGGVGMYDLMQKLRAESGAR